MKYFQHHQHFATVCGVNLWQMKGSEPGAGLKINVCRTLKSFHPSVGAAPSVTNTPVLKGLWVAQGEELDGVWSVNAVGAREASRIICSLLLEDCEVCPALVWFCVLEVCCLFFFPRDSSGSGQHFCPGVKQQIHGTTLGCFLFTASPTPGRTGRNCSVRTGNVLWQRITQNKERFPAEHNLIMGCALCILFAPVGEK